MVTWINYIDECIYIVKVVRPHLAKFELSTNVPTVELDLFVLESLNIKANCRDCVYDFI